MCWFLNLLFNCLIHLMFIFRFSVVFIVFVKLVIILIYLTQAIVIDIIVAHRVLFFIITMEVFLGACSLSPPSFVLRNNLSSEGFAIFLFKEIPATDDLVLDRVGISQVVTQQPLIVLFLPRLLLL